jgi:hypothetical protein
MRKPYLFTVLLALLVSACSTPAPTQQWRGQSQDAQGTHPLSLDLQQTGTVLKGSYLVGSGRGTFDGALDGTSLTATLTPGSGCSYSFSGTLSETRLTGDYLPTSCPGGLAGSWTLTRE